MGLDVAMVKFTAGLRSEVLGYERGDRVRVDAVYDKVSAGVPSLRGLRVEAIAKGGLVSTE